jgi:hypothetical protein
MQRSELIQCIVQIKLIADHRQTKNVVVQYTYKTVDPSKAGLMAKEIRER